MVEVTPLPWLTAVWTAAGFGLLWWLARRFTEGRLVRNVLLASYVARVALAAGLFCISYGKLPILSSFQTWPGFWVFSYDAPLYHRIAMGILDSWAKGIELPYFEVGVEYFALVAAVYKFFGAHPIYPMLLNCFLAALNGLLAYRIILRLADRPAARVAAILVSCWPSSFLWSAQLLKDAPSWFLIFCILLLTLRLLPPAGASPRMTPGRWGLRAALLAVLVIALTRFRFYVASSYSIAAALILLPAAALSLRRRQFVSAAAYASLIALITASTIFARTLNTRALFTPSHPEESHYRMALKAFERQDAREAKNQLSLAITANPAYKEPYPALAAMEIEAGNFLDALLLYQTYLSLEPDPEKRRLARQIAIQLWLNKGNVYLHVDPQEAARIYQEALRFDPTHVAVYINLAVARCYQEKYELAFQALENARPYAASDAQRQQIDQERQWVADQQARFWEEMQRFMAWASTQPGFASFTEEQLAELKYFWRQQQRDQEARFAESDSVTLLDKAQVMAAAETLFTAERSRGVQSARSPGKMRQVIYDARSLGPVTLQKTYGATPETLDAVRQAFIYEGGSSIIDPKVFISDPASLVTYLPRALAIGFLAPFPWHWGHRGGSMGRLQMAASIEALLIYFLMPAVLVGAYGFVKRRQIAGVLLMACVLMTAIPISLVIANFGTLFRVRLLFLMPLLLIAAAGHPLQLYHRWFHLVMARMRPAEDAPEGAQT